MGKKVLELLHLSSLVTIANVFYHITPEEAGLYQAEIAKDIVALFNKRRANVKEG